MRATIMYAAGDVRVENVPDATIVEPTDAIVRVTRACICGSDLWPYRSMERSDAGQSMGHEAIGVVEAVGRAVGKVKVGDLVHHAVRLLGWRCEFCHEGLQPLVCTADSSATAGSTVPRRRRCACPRPTARSIRCLAAPTRR